MNLYEIQFEHSAPKDQQIGISCFLVAENDDSVYEWIKSEPKTKQGSLFNGWGDSEKNGEEFEIYDKGYEQIGTETFKEKMIRLCGQIDDPSNDYTDSYYGITFYGWDKISENVPGGLFDLLKGYGIDIYHAQGQTITA